MAIAALLLYHVRQATSFLSSEEKHGRFGIPINGFKNSLTKLLM